MSRRPRKNHRQNTSGIDPPNFLGQHFMHNKRLIQSIIDYADIKHSDTVLELGAGKGALTFQLAKRAKKVIAVEYDARLVDLLQHKAGSYSNIKMIHRDMLTINLPREKFVVVSNIPYAITTPIMKKLLNTPSSGFQRGVIVMEKGAAKRFTSRYVKDSYVILWRMYFDIEYVRCISRRNFSPPPSVDSALVQIKRKDKPVIPFTASLSFWALAHEVLKFPRSPIDCALSGIFTVTQISRLRRNLRVEPVFPVGFLTERQWGVIFEAMIKHVPHWRWPKIDKKKLSQKKNR